MDTVWTLFYPYMYMICVWATILVRGAVDIKCNFEIDNCYWKSQCNALWEIPGNCKCNPPCNTPLIPEKCTPTQSWNETAWERVEEDSCKPPIKSRTETGGHYIRIQTYLHGKTSCLVNSKYEQTLAKCLYFWSYISGPAIKSFGVYVNSTTISSINVMQQNKWYQHAVNINGNHVKDIALIASFEYYNGKDTGDGRCIAVDDVEIKDGDCSVVPASADKSSSSSNTTGIIVGVVVGIGIVVGLGTFLWCYIRRSKYVCKKPASRDNQILSNASTEQSVALPGLFNPTSTNDGYTEIQTKNDKYQHVNSHLNTSINISDRKYAQLDQSKNLSDNMAGHSLHANGATNHDYIYFDETEAGSTQSSIHVPGVNMLNEEIHKSNEYAVIDPNCDHSSGMAKDITHSTPSLGNYAILDPNETGFFRSKGNKETTTDYEFAVPINDNECVSDLHDPYTVSEDGAYDSTNMIRHKDAETNIYNHAAENVYDTSSHERKIVNKEGTYDHFFGDETEDNYNISKRE